MPKSVTSTNFSLLSLTAAVMIMERGDERYIFSDCAMNIDPDSDTLAEIGYQDTSSLLAPRERSLIGAARPSKTGPTALKLPKRWAIL